MLVMNLQKAAKQQQLFSTSWWRQNFWALSHQLSLSVVCRWDPMWVTTAATAAGTNKAPVAAALQPKIGLGRDLLSLESPKNAVVVVLYVAS